MAQVKSYSPFGNTPKGLYLEHFQGVYNDGLGANLPPSLVNYAENADDQWRGAAKKRNGYEKFLTKNFPVNNAGAAFDGLFYQGEADVWYRVELLVNFRLRPMADDPVFDSWSGIGYGGFAGVGQAADSATAESGAFDGSLTPGGADAPFVGAQEWRYRHIAVAVNQRRDFLGLAASTLPLNTADADITYNDINNARAEIEGMATLAAFALAGVDVDDTAASPENNAYFIYSDYNDMLLKANVGGGVPREWTNINAAGAVVYANNMSATDTNKPYMFAEMETVLRAALSYTAANTLPVPGTPRRTIYSNVESSASTAWANRNTNFHPYSHHPAACILQIAPAQFQAFESVPTSSSMTISSLNTSYVHNVYFYIRPVTAVGNNTFGISDTIYHDYFGVIPDRGKYQIAYTSGDVSAASVSKTFTATVTQPPASSYGKWYGATMQGQGDPAWAEADTGMNAATFSHIHWTFPEDAKLGRRTL